MSRRGKKKARSTKCQRTQSTYSDFYERTKGSIVLYWRALHTKFDLKVQKSTQGNIPGMNRERWRIAWNLEERVLSALFSSFEIGPGFKVCEVV